MRTSPRRVAAASVADGFGGGRSSGSHFEDAMITVRRRYNAGAGTNALTINALHADHPSANRRYCSVCVNFKLQKADVIHVGHCFIGVATLCVLVFSDAYLRRAIFRCAYTHHRCCSRLRTLLCTSLCRPVSALLSEAVCRFVGFWRALPNVLQSLVLNSPW